MTSSSTKPFQHFLEPEFVVGISVAYGELAEFTGGPFYAEVARQAMVERRAINFNEVDLGKLGKDSQGAVCRAAVDDDDFVNGDGLLEDALYALPDALGLVPDRDDDGNCWEGHQTSFCQAGGMFLGTSMWPNFFP